MVSGRGSIHCLSVVKQRAVGHVQCTSKMVGAMGSGSASIHWLTGGASLVGSNGQWDSFSTVPHCRGAVGSGSPQIHCLTIMEHWVVDLLRHTASLLGSSGLSISFRTLPRCWGVVGSGSPSIYCLGAGERWEVDLLQYAPARAGSNGSASPLVHRLTAGERGAMGSGSPSV